MDKQQSLYFYYGGIFSFSFFAFLLVLLYVQISASFSPTVFTKTDNILISVSLDDITLDKPLPQKKKKAANPVESVEEVVDDLDDIFDSIESEKIIYSKKTIVKDEPIVDKEFLKKIQTRKDVKHDRDRKVHKKREELSLENSDFKSQEKSTKASGGEKDEYKAKVYALLYGGWNHTSEKFERVQVSIRLSAQGKMRYEIKQVSGDSAFDESVQAHLEYLLDTMFPKSPDGKPVHFRVYFTTKGNNA